MKRLIYFIISLIALTLLPACRQTQKYRIGVSQCSNDDWRTKLNDELMREVMLLENVEVEIRSADDDNQKQIDDIRYFAANGFDMLIVSPNEAEALTPVIKEVYESGKPVILFDRNINANTYTVHIGADNPGLGQAAGRYALHLAGPGANAIEIYGLPGSTPAIGRHEGFAKKFTEGGGNILASAPGNWKKEDAMPVVDSLLRLYPDVDIIYAHNDRMAIGASEVATRLGRRDKIKIIGIDAAPGIGIKAVADSIIDATFLYPTEGHKIIRTALDILEGKQYDKEIVLPSSSPVDLSNADILLLQDKGLKEETHKVQELKTRFDAYWDKHTSQTVLLYASIVIIVLLFVSVFLILRAYWQRRRHQAQLLDSNIMLERQRDELASQRDQLQELNEKLTEATRTKLTFFTNVSHDLRTPLTLISEPVAQLSEATNLTPQQHRLIKIADKNVRILRRLINQILDFRKYENNKMSLHLSEIDLGQAITDWMEGFYALARKRNLTLTLDKPAEPVVLAIDAEKFERVFFNLVSNAFKYTPDGGKITVNYGIEDNKLRLTVADTGEGISERDLGNIFDRFFQVDRVHPNGSGIGLSLCKAFVELHGGSISVESTLHKGSRFMVEIPVTHVAGAPVALESTIKKEDVEAELDVIETDVEIDENKPVLLVIDDNRDIRMLLSELMGGEYNVIQASGALQGIKRAVKYVPDLIICDVMMPGVDGLECCRRLKAETTTSHIPVLMLTACSMDEQRVQGYESGADGYLSKPFSNDVLRSRCASLIANRKRIKDLWEASPKPAAGRQLPSSDIDNDFYNRFLSIFEAEMGNSELSVDALAAKLGLERSQFYRKIKSLTNMSPVELMKNMRLKRAKHMLQTTDASISEVAYSTGFSTPAYFTRCYREAFGETPSETRSSLKA